MKYVSIDIETTGIDTENDQILSIGLVIEDTKKKLPIDELPKLHIAILRERITGRLFSLNMNKQLIENIVNYDTAKTSDEKSKISKETQTVYLKEEEVCPEIFRFLWDNGIRYDGWEKSIVGGLNHYVGDKAYPVLNSSIKVVYLNVAGKNFGTFDKPFLERLPRWKQLFKFRNRILDPTITFVDWENDEELPGLSECKVRAGLSDVVTHNAVDDAIDVIELLRTQY